eukprot:CAMPEP_0118646846 /NCGR_PEP_ID=MMETSP0785-20121206/8284_1 /TAXON_ID=91992 /ORGANISM="Bolidomonas pacifica, Strain CCMP 1866" /LENGTH=614 /DNA_ID=CAMNT_0006538887 /DNA_START=35 /DNA_END=1875 /DNA_ORIENTATION=+
MHSESNPPPLLHLSIGVLFGNLGVVLVIVTIYAAYRLFSPVIGVLFVALLASSIVRRRKLQIKSLLTSISTSTLPITSQIHVSLKRSVSLVASDFSIILNSVCDHPFIALIVLCSVYLYVFHLFHPLFLFLKTLLFTILAIVLHLFDKSLFFSYHRIFTDDTLSSILTISEVFLATSFLSTFILTQGIMDGTEAVRKIGNWIKSELEDDVGSQWESVLGIIAEQIESANATYSNTTWWGVVEPVVTGIISGRKKVSTPSRQAPSSMLTLTNLTSTVKEAVMSLNLTSADLTQYMDVGASSGKVMLSTLVDFVGTMIGLFSAISDYAVSLILFISVVMFLLNSPSDPLTLIFTDLLPHSLPSTPSYITEMLCNVLLLPLKLAATHAVIIVTIVSLMGGKHSFLSAGLCFLQAFFPIAPAFLIPVPWALSLVVEGSWVRGLLCFVGVKAAMSYCDERVMRSQVGISPLFTSLSVLLGYRSFGRNGVLCGPLILCAIKLVYEGIRAAEESRVRTPTSRTRTASDVLTKIRQVLTPRGGMDSGRESLSSDDRKELFKNAKKIVGVRRKGAKRGEAPVRVAFGNDDFNGMKLKIRAALGMGEREDGGIIRIEGDDGCVV